MARTIHYTASAGVTTTITIRTSRVRKAELDRETRISVLIEKICKLADEYVARSIDEPEREGYPQRIAFYERQLSRIGVCKAEIYSFVNRAPVPPDA